MRIYLEIAFHILFSGCILQRENYFLEWVFHKTIIEKYVKFFKYQLPPIKIVKRERLVFRNNCKFVLHFMVMKLSFFVLVINFHLKCVIPFEVN